MMTKPRLKFLATVGIAGALAAASATPTLARQYHGHWHHGYHHARAWHHEHYGYGPGAFLGGLAAGVGAAVGGTVAAVTNPYYYGSSQGNNAYAYAPSQAVHWGPEAYGYDGEFCPYIKAQQGLCP